MQLHVYFKKWTLKFKLLYLRNYISYFNKISMISCVNTHIKSLKVWLKSMLPWLIYSFFSRVLFFIGAPCRYSVFRACQSCSSWAYRYWSWLRTTKNVQFNFQLMSSSCSYAGPLVFLCMQMLHVWGWGVFIISWWSVWCSATVGRCRPMLPHALRWTQLSCSLRWRMVRAEIFSHI